MHSILVPTSFSARLWKTPWGGRPGLEGKNLPYSCGNSTGLEPVSPLSLCGTFLAIYLDLIVAGGMRIVKQNFCIL